MTYPPYQSRLDVLKMLLLIYEINDIISFIKSYKEPTTHFTSIIIHSLAPQTLGLVLHQS